MNSPLEADEVQQMKSELIGKVMGGRERCWRFQSTSQIKDLEIKSKKEEGTNRIYSIVMELSDSRVSGVHRAEADVIYKKTGITWKIEMVGLQSLVRIKEKNG
jgi:hypothetical protein